MDFQNGKRLIFTHGKQRQKEPKKTVSNKLNFEEMFGDDETDESPRFVVEYEKV